MGSHPHFAVFVAQYFIQIASRGLDFGQPPSLCRACRPKLQIVVFDLVKAFIISFRIVFCDRYFPLQYIQVDECLQDEIERINEAIHRADGYGYNLHTVSHRYFIVEKFIRLIFGKAARTQYKRANFSIWLKCSIIRPCQILQRLHLIWMGDHGRNSRI